MFLPAGGSGLFFISPGWWIGNKQLFKVGLIFTIFSFVHPIKSFKFRDHCQILFLILSKFKQNSLLLFLHEIIQKSFVSKLYFAIYRQVYKSSKKERVTELLILG